VSKLKAFVRFDGTGKIVPSSIILAKSKPKVGNWKEIDANLCCNLTTTTTTVPPTTTTTTTTPIPFLEKLYVAFKSYDACNEQLGTKFFASGDGTTFCDSTILTGNGFASLAPGFPQVFITYNGEIRTANYVSGQNFVTFTTGCSNCP
jgi:hypothetical protein